MMFGSSSRPQSPLLEVPSTFGRLFYQPLYAWGSNATIWQPSGLNYSVFEMTINLLNPPGPGLNGGCIGAGSPYQGVWVWTAIIQGGVSVISSSAMVRGEVNLGSGNGALRSNNAGAALQAVTLSGACHLSDPYDSCVRLGSRVPLIGAPLLPRVPTASPSVNGSGTQMGMNRLAAESLTSTGDASHVSERHHPSKTPRKSSP